jgi:hypothetical protein
LRNDDVYRQVFDKKWNLNVFVASLEITRAVQGIIRETRSSDVAPIALSHYVAHLYACKKLQRWMYRPDDIASLFDDIPSRSDVELILEEVRAAVEKYHGGANARRYRGIPLDRNFIEWFARSTYPSDRGSA